MPYSLEQTTYTRLSGKSNLLSFKVCIGGLSGRLFRPCTCLRIYACLDRVHVYVYMTV